MGEKKKGQYAKCEIFEKLQTHFSSAKYHFILILDQPSETNGELKSNTSCPFHVLYFTFLLS